MSITNNRIVLAFLSNEIFDVIRVGSMDYRRGLNAESPFRFTAKEIKQARKDRFWIAQRYDALKDRNDVLWSHITSKTDWLESIGVSENKPDLHPVESQRPNIPCDPPWIGEDD